MMFNQKGFGALLVPFMLMGCLGPVATFSSGNSKYVTYQVFSSSSTPEAAKMAQEYCADFGKESVPQVNSSEEIKFYILRTFECK